MTVWTWRIDTSGVQRKWLLSSDHWELLHEVFQSGEDGSVFFGLSVNELQGVSGHDRTYEFIQHKQTKGYERHTRSGCPSLQRWEKKKTWLLGEFKTGGQLTTKSRNGNRCAGWCPDLGQWVVALDPPRDNVGVVCMDTSVCTFCVDANPANRDTGHPSPVTS